MSEWRPGMVAMIRSTNSDAYMRAVRRGGVWFRLDSEGYVIDAYTEDVRPLVVIDPEDREQVERVRGALWRGGDLDAWQAGLRSLVTEPRIDEPGMWGVVEAASARGSRRKWMRREDGFWFIVGPSARRTWADLIDPVLVREGVEW